MKHNSSVNSMKTESNWISDKKFKISPKISLGWKKNQGNVFPARKQARDEKTQFGKVKDVFRHNPQLSQYGKFKSKMDLKLGGSSPLSRFKSP